MAYKTNDTGKHQDFFCNSKSKQRETVLEHGVDSRDVFVEFSFCRFFMYFKIVGCFFFLSWYMHKQAHLATHPHTLSHTHTVESNQMLHVHRAPLNIFSPSDATHCCGYFYITSRHSAASVRPRLCPFQRLCIPNIRKLKNTVTPTREMVAGAVKNCL